MMRHPRRQFLGLAVSAIVALAGGESLAQDEAITVSARLRDLKSSDFERAFTAAQSLGRYPRQRARIVPALIAAIKTGRWPRCGGDMRDAIARTLVDLKAKEAVVPLLELAASGRTIDHECVE
jgi:HEAT repeat protein